MWDRENLDGHPAFVYEKGSLKKGYSKDLENLDGHPAFVEEKGSLKVGSSKVRSKVRHFGMRSAI